MSKPKTKLTDVLVPMDIPTFDDLEELPDYLGIDFIT